MAVDEVFIENQSRRVVRWLDHGDPEVTGSGNNLAVVRADVAGLRTAIASLATALGLSAADIKALLNRPPLTQEQVDTIGNLTAAAVTDVLAGTSLELSDDDKAELANASAQATLDKLRQHPLIPTPVG